MPCNAMVPVGKAINISISTPSRRWLMPMLMLGNDLPGAAKQPLVTSDADGDKNRSIRQDGVVQYSEKARERFVKQGGHLPVRMAAHIIERHPNAGKQYRIVNYACTVVRGFTRDNAERCQIAKIFVAFERGAIAMMKISASASKLRLAADTGVGYVA